MNAIDPEHKDTFLDVITGVSLRLAAATDTNLDQIIGESLEAIGSHEGAHRAYITLMQPDGRFSNTHEWVAPGIPSHREAITDRDTNEFPWSTEKLLAGEVWNSRDISELPPEATAERDSFAAFGVVSVLQVPMRNGNKLVGALGINHAGPPMEWTSIHVDRMRRLSDAIGFALLRRDANRLVQAARDSAERAHRARAILLSTVSHEMRTPLHAILGFAELLDSPGRTTDERDAVREILSSGHQLLGLVEEMLRIADEQSGHQPIE
jgi:signal transduction histidine kinase